MESVYIAVLTHLPETGKTYYTPFTDGELAIAFREAEEARGDFPGSLWTIVANAGGREELRRARMKMFGLSEEAAA